MIKNNKVYIYAAKMTNEYHSFLSLLNKIDSQKYLHFKNEKRKKSFVCGRALLSIALRHHLDRENYQLIYNSLGKPELIDCDNWSFNLSHSGDYIFLILSQRNCGIDCEFVKSRNIDKLLFIFNENNQKKISESNSPLDCFYQLWTQKEAIVKYLGKSIFSSNVNVDELTIKTYQFEDVWFSICLEEKDLNGCFYYHKF